MPDTNQGIKTMEELNESKEALINILTSTPENDFQNLEDEEVKEFTETFNDFTERIENVYKKQ